MSEQKRPGQGGLFDIEASDNLFNETTGGKQAPSLFGEYTPPTPKQNIPPQNPAPQRPVGQQGASAQGQRPLQQPVQPQQRPAQPTPNAQQAQRPAAPQQPRQQAVPQNAAPQRPAAPAGQPGVQRPAAPGTSAPQGTTPQQNPATRPVQQRPQQAQPPQQQGQMPRQPVGQPPVANNGATQVLGNTRPAANDTPARGNGQVYRQADSGQRLSQFAPKPAAQQAEGPTPRQAAAPQQTQRAPAPQGQTQINAPQTQAAPPQRQQAAAQNGHTRVVNQPAAENKPFAGFDDATRVGQAIPPQNAQATRNAGGPENRNANGTPADGGKSRGAGGNRNGGNGNGGGKNGKGKNGKPGEKPKGKTVAKYVFINIGKFALTCMCIGVIIASILFVQVAGYVVESTANDDLTLDLDAIASSQTGYMWAKDANGEYTIEYMQIVGESNFRWASLSEISPYVVDALISTEDKQFYSHGGVSWSRTAYAALNEVFGLTDKQFGASTITQQLVKNLTQDNVVTDAETGATAGYMRKMREIFRAIGINNSYSKNMVLEAYLNTMPLTGTIKGVGAGAYEYFGKEPIDLELHEAAMIVGITNWPTKYSPYSNPENCLQRRNDVLYFMYQDEIITKSQFDEACAKDLGLVSSVPSNQVETVTTWYADAAINQVIDDLADALFGGERAAASSYFYNAGLNVQLNVDLDIQAALEDMYLHAYEEDSPFPDVSTTLDDGTVVRPQSAMTIMDYSGHVLASVGGTGQKTVSRALNRASSSPRQVGSTMKGIANYPLGLEYNLITYSTNLIDEKCWFSDSVYKTGADGLPAYDWPTNYGNKITGNSMGVYTAMAQSTNTIAVRVGLAVGEDEMFDFAYHSMGLTNLIPKTENDQGDVGMSSLVLGGQRYGATTEQMAAAYAIYGNGGQYNEARYYTQVLDSKGNVVLRANNYTTQAVSEDTAYIMNKLLYNVVNMSGGTANGMGVDGFETVGKTGTTSDDNDRWFVGLTPYYVGAIWWGYDSDYTLDGYSPAASTNGTTRPWKYVMNQIHEGLPEKSFPEMPEGVKTEAFCRETGMLATEECGNRGTGYYKVDNLPEPCMGHSESAEGEEAA